MQKLKNIIIKKQFFLLGLLIISIPFLEFIKVNYFSLDKVMYKNILSYFSFAIIVYYFFYFFLKRVIKKKSNRIKYILCFSIFIWGLFQFEYLQNFLYLIGSDKYSKNNLSAEISLLGILFLSLIFLNLRFTNFVYKFLVVFFVAQYFFIFFNLSKNYIVNNFVNDDYSFATVQKKTNFFSEEEINIIKKNKNSTNIYYLVIDEMTSLEEYKKLGGQKNTEKWIDKFSTFGYYYVPNTYSTFNDTNTTFGSIFNLHPIITDRINLSDDLYTELTYPTIISNDQFTVKQYPNLIKNLNKINYEFKWIGNHKYNCKIYNINLCLENNLDSLNNNNFLEKNINFYVLKIFLENTPIEELFRIYNRTFNSNSEIINNADNISEDDAIEKFISRSLKFKKEDQLYFYFLHDHIIKEPYQYNANCDKITYTNEDEVIDINISGYIKTYECVIKKLNKFITFLNKNDPNATVIIQSDHGFRAPYKDYKDIRRYEIFNLIKVNDSCKTHISNNIDNVNSARFALSCATSTSVKILEKKTYFTNKRKAREPITIEINLK